MSEENVVIELKGLTKRYGYGDTESFALKDFNLTVKRGEFIMIMGPSGCGKTTLLNIIGLLDRATDGEYFLNGEDVAGISAARQARLRARKIGFIFQNFNLINDLPILENVALPLVYTGQSKLAQLRQASSVLDRFHLQEREYYMPSQLSGGQQQRVSIARAIVSDPEIILADEPTGNLDSRSSHIVMEELKNIHEEGNTIIMVTHNPMLTTYATRVINMLDGQIDTDIKTVADQNLPQPVEVRRVKKTIYMPKAELKEQLEKTDEPKAEKIKAEAKDEKVSEPEPKINETTAEKEAEKIEKTEKAEKTKAKKSRRGEKVVKAKVAEEKAKEKAKEERKDEEEKEEVKPRRRSRLLRRRNERKKK